MHSYSIWPLTHMEAVWPLFVQHWAQPNNTTSQQSLFTQVQPRQTEFISACHMDICSHPSWQDLGIAYLTLAFLFLIPAQPQAVYSNLINTISLNVAKKYGKQRQTLPRMWHLFSNRISIDCFQLNKEGERQKRNKERSYKSTRAQIPPFTNT